MDYIERVYSNINIREGIHILEDFLTEVYFQGNTSNKYLSRKLSLPIPIIVAIKKEFVKEGVLVQNKGIKMTEKGLEYVENELEYKGIDKELLFKILKDNYDLEKDFAEEIKYLEDTFNKRPGVDVTIDQTKCTPETSFKRAILALKHNSLIGKSVLCIGDDDLVSISVSMLLRRLYTNSDSNNTQIQVLDIDERFLEYINEIAEKEGFNISVLKSDFRKSLPEELQNKFDCFFVDPPYTLDGMKLFISRGLQGLNKDDSEQCIFFSFAHKFPEFRLKMQKAFNEMELIITQILPGFNEYEGAAIIGNKGQMIVLNTTPDFKPLIEGEYNNPIYTGELNQKTKRYKCKECKHVTKLGGKWKYKTIEELKEHGCPKCNGKVFKLLTGNKKR